jgi:hypothetical protein
MNKINTIPTTIDPVLMAAAEALRDELGPIFCDAARAAFANAHPTEESLPDWWQLDDAARETHKIVAAHVFALGMQAMATAQGAGDIVQPPSPPEPQERLAPPLPDAASLMAGAERNVKDGVDPMFLVPSGRQFLQDAQGAGNPFDGHTVEPWDEDSKLWSIDGDGGHYLLGLIDEDGWSAWLPLVASELERGPETGDEGRRLTEDALIKAGATIPWREGNP